MALRQRSTLDRTPRQQLLGNGEKGGKKGGKKKGSLQGTYQPITDVFEFSVENVARSDKAFAARIRLKHSQPGYPQEGQELKSKERQEVVVSFIQNFVKDFGSRKNLIQRMAMSPSRRWDYNFNLPIADDFLKEFNQGWRSFRVGMDDAENDSLLSNSSQQAR